MKERIPRQQSPDMDCVIAYFQSLQINISDALSEVDRGGKGGGSEFREDSWSHQNGGGGRSRVLENGLIFEKAGVNFSHVKGDKLPTSATSGREQLAGKPFEATGVSLVIHPNNPFVPTTHMNVRMFIADPNGSNPVWWFGGGYDLTPYYGFVEDCRHWHQTAKDACDQLDKAYYEKFKHWCDQYFYLKHRDEPRGVGGLFFDDFSSDDFDHGFDLVQAVGNSFTEAYLPIVSRRKDMEWEQHHTEFQQYRRGRYVEFNLVFDRGTIFGLQSGGRIESILMSLPPKVRWWYDWRPQPGSKEAELYDVFLKPRDWISC